MLQQNPPYYGHPVVVPTVSALDGLHSILVLQYEAMLLRLLISCIFTKYLQFCDIMIDLVAKIVVVYKYAYRTMVLFCNTTCSS